MQVRNPFVLWWQLAILTIITLGWSGTLWAQESDVVETAAPQVADATGTLVVLNKAEASASLLNLATGKEVHKIPTGVGPHEVAISPDGKTAVVADYGANQGGSTLTVINLEAHAVQKTIDLSPHLRPHGIEYLADGKRVVVTSERSQMLLVVNIELGEVVQTIETAAQASHMVAVTPNGERAFVANIASGSITAIDLVANKMIKEIKTGAGAEGIAVTPNGNEVWVTNRSADTVSVVDVNSLDVLAELPCASFPIRVKVTPDGKRALVSNAQSGDVAVFDVEKRELLKRISMNEIANEDAENRLFSDQFGKSPVPVGILISPDGKHAYVANTNADIVTVIDLTTLEIVNRLRAGKEPDGLGWSPLVLQ